MRHPVKGALLLKDLRPGDWFRFFDTNGNERFVARLMVINAGHIVYVTLQSAHLGYLGYADQGCVPAYQLGLEPVQLDNASVIWMGGYCLPIR